MTIDDKAREIAYAIIKTEADLAKVNNLVTDDIRRLISAEHLGRFDAAMEHATKALHILHKTAHDAAGSTGEIKPTFGK